MENGEIQLLLRVRLAPQQTVMNVNLLLPYALVVNKISLWWKMEIAYLLVRSENMGILRRQSVLYALLRA